MPANDLSQMAEMTAPSPGKVSERAWLFGLLVAPIAVLSNGVISGALSLLLRGEGVSLTRTAQIVSLLNLPQVLYFLWSPVTDFWVRRRTWLVLGAALSATILVIVFARGHLASPASVALVFLSACFGQVIVSSCGGMMGTLRREATRRRASSFYQAGSLGFGAIGVFVIALLAGRIHLGVLGVIIGAMVLLPALAVFGAPEQLSTSQESLKQVRMRIAAEFRGTFWRKEAIPYTLMMVFPMASGALIGLLPGLASDYGVSSSQVAWMNGLLGAGLTAAGAFAVSLLPARVRASVAYLSAGLVNAGTLAILVLGPRTPTTYLAGVILFLFTIGACYALFTAVVLEFLGVSGKSGSTRYSIINSLGNVPVTYMNAVDAFGAAHWGPRGMTAIDAIVSVVGGGLLLAYVLIGRVQPPAAAVLEDTGA